MSSFRDTKKLKLITNRQHFFRSVQFKSLEKISQPLNLSSNKRSA